MFHCFLNTGTKLILHSKVETREDRFLKKVSLPVDKLSKDSHSSAVEKTDTARHPEHKSNSAESVEKESGVPEKGRKKWKVTQYEYFDPGDHWCRQCNLIFGKCEALFQHLHSAKHIDVSISRHLAYLIGINDVDNLEYLRVFNYNQI